MNSLVQKTLFIIATASLMACNSQSPDVAASTAGGTDVVTPTPGTGGEATPDPIEKAIIYDGTIDAADGETIGITVYQPALNVGETAPLILHGHGFGLSRAKNFEGNNPVDAFLHADTTGEAATAAWNDGYYVISFDQRGFGDSSGNVSMMSPDVDGRNVSTIIDWALDNLDYIRLDSPSDPVLGSVGLSYGGGFQTVTSSIDHRFDAIVPSATWNHLPYSLAPYGIPKSIWLNILVGLGGPGAQFAFDQDLIAGMLQAQSGTVPDSLIEQLAASGPRRFCEGSDDGRGPSTTPAFFIQGSKDVLFNFNEAAWNYECWQQNSPDSRLLVQNDGHIIPLLQQSGEQVLFGGDEEVLCDGETFNVLQMTLDFLNFHLKATPMVKTIPEVCIADALNMGKVFDAVPRGGEFTQFAEISVMPGVAGQVVNALTQMNPADTVQLLVDSGAVSVGNAVSLLLNLTNILTDPTAIADIISDSIPDIVNLLPSDAINTATSTPVWVELYTVAEDGVLAGIPLANLEINGGGGSVSLYYGLGVKRQNTGTPELIDDQVLPFPETDEYELAGVAEKVASGDVIGLLVYPFHPYYLNNSLLAINPSPITVSGTVEIPFYAD